MATTITEIANSALIKLGQSTIISVDDGSVVANVCKTRFNDCKRAVLRMHPWNCAIDRVALAPLTTPPAFGYGYQFQLPANFLRVLDVGPDDPGYRVEGRKLLSDSQVIELKYIYDVQVIEELDALLTEAIACYLAWDISYKITNSSEAKAEAWRMFQTAIRSAKSVDAQEETGFELEADLFVDSRVSGVRGPKRANR